jgi:hypothetical protein
LGFCNGFGLQPGQLEFPALATERSSITSGQTAADELPFPQPIHEIDPAPRGDTEQEALASGA